MHESGMLDFEFEHLYDRFTSGKGFMVLTQKSSSRIESPPVVLPVIRLPNTKVFFSVMAGMVAVSILVLVAEVIKHQRKNLWNDLKNRLVTATARFRLLKKKKNVRIIKIKTVSLVRKRCSSEPNIRIRTSNQPLPAITVTEN